ncbi:MAG: EAL domain-containing protein [Betaproteobacteria bacterium]|nr:EAL domain-containing protein [Betaproteobacteria bacterium]
MNRALARQIRKLAGVGTVEALERALAEAVAAAPGLPASPELKALLAGLEGLLGRVDATYDQYDRDLDLRTRSLELTSEELIGANERLRADLATRNRVLEALRDAAATLLRAGDENVSVPDPGDVEGLSALVPVLVRQQEANRAALAESERKFSDLYQNTPVMLHASDESDVLSSVNDYWLSQLGYERGEVVGRKMTEFMTQESRRHAQEEVLPAFRRTGFCKDVALRLVKKDGAVLDVLVTAYSERDDDGVVIRSLAAMVDVTERGKAQQLQAALHGISDAAHSASDLQEVLLRIHGIIGELLPARNFFVALYDEASRFVSFPYFIDEHDSVPAPRMLGEGGLTEEVLRTGEALLLTPQTMESRISQGETIFGTDSIDWLGVPLKTKDRTIGVLAVQSYAGSVRYADGDKALLQFVSDQVASAIERKRAETALKESEERLQRALEASRLALWDYDIAGGAVYLSEAWSEFLGGAREPTVTRLETLALMVPPEDQPVIWAAVVPALRGEQPQYQVEHRVIRPDGGTIWVLSQGRVIERGEDGRARRAVGTNRDITAHKRREEDLQLAALVYRHSSEAMMVSDSDNRIIAINPAFTALTGYAADEVIGKNPRLLSSGRQGPEFYRTMWESLRTAGQWQGEVWNRHKNGQMFAEALAINTIRHADGSIHRYVALFSDITDKKEAQSLIWHQANFDALTHLPNRRMFRDRLEQDLKKCRRDGSGLAILFIDLDRFKEVNDTLGHDKGDTLLIEAARRIRECVRESDMVARLGGDEFTVALSSLEDASHVQYIAQKVIDSLAAAFILGPEKVFVSASIGITLFPGDATEIEDLFKHADQALYAAKAAGRNRFSYFTAQLQVAALARMHMTNDMRGALAAGQFSLYFQPVVELATGRIRKAEALIRWRHPQHGLISPARFIPLAEASGLIVDIGAWVFREAARWVRRWREAGHREFQVSINQSPREFQREGNIYAGWMEHLEEAGLPGQCIAVEITEGLLLDASPEVKAKLFELRDAGIEVALDDFGVGYSSLSYLKNLHIDYLKIDQSFTANLAPGSSDMALSEAIIVMAHKLGLKVIAEGVETAAQRDLLLAAGCDYAQGYLFAEPMAAEAFEAFLAGKRDERPPEPRPGRTSPDDPHDPPRQDAGRGAE